MIFYWEGLLEMFSPPLSFPPPFVFFSDLCWVRGWPRNLLCWASQRSQKGLKQRRGRPYACLGPPPQTLSLGTGGRGHYERGLFTGGISRIFIKSLDSLESLENGRIFLCFPQSGGSLKSLNSLESLENRLSEKTPFPKDPFFRTRKRLETEGVTLRMFGPPSPDPLPN